MNPNDTGGALPERGGLLGGLALLAATAFMLEVILTRVCAVVLGSEVAYALPVLAVLSAGFGAIAAGLGRWGAAEPGSRDLPHFAYGCMGASVSTVALGILLVHMSHAKPGAEDVPGFGTHSIATWLAVVGTSSLPFALCGAIVARSLRSLSDALPLFGFVHLAGAAVGSLGSILAIRSGGPRAFLVVALLFVFAALAFSIGAWRSTPSRIAPSDAERATAEGVELAPRPGWVATALIGVSTLLAGDLGAPWLKLRAPKGEKVEFSAWSELGLLTIDKASGGAAWIREDGRKDNPIYDGKQVPPPEPEEVAYVLHPNSASVLVLDAAGGRQVRVARKTGHREVDAVVLSPTLAHDVMLGNLAEWSGRVYDGDGVNLVVDDGRSFVRRKQRQYDVVMLAPYSPPDTPKATRATNPGDDADSGAPGRPAPPFDTVLVRPLLDAADLAEARLFTQEAFVDYLRLLEPGGTLVVRRPAGELDRTRELALLSLAALPVAAPEAHLFACTHKGALALVAQLEPLSAADLKLLRKHCKTNKFAEVIAPDDGDSKPKRKRKGSGSASAQAPSPQAGPIAEDDGGAPPSDDRPFAVRDVKSRGLRALLGSFGQLSGDATERAAFVTLFGSLVAAAVALGAAWRVARRRGGEPITPDSDVPPWRSLLGLAAIGAALSWAQMGLASPLVALLGHPVHALAVVAPLALLSLAFGSLAAARLDHGRPTKGLAFRGAFAAAVGIALAFGLWPAIRVMGSLPFGVRLAASIVVTGALGVLAGILLPLGLRSVGRTCLPLGWAFFVIGGVLGTGIGTVVAAHVGFSAVLLSAGLTFGVLSFFLPASLRESRSVVVAIAPDG